MAAKRSNLKDRLLENRFESYRVETRATEHKRVPSAGSREFKINYNNASPNTSELRAKKAPVQVTIPVSNSMHSNVKRNNYVEPDASNLSALVSKKLPPGILKPLNPAPLTSFQRKIKDMLGTGQSFLMSSGDKSSISHKRVKSNSKLEPPSKSRKVIHKKTPSAKLEFAPKVQKMPDLSATLPRSDLSATLPRSDLSDSRLASTDLITLKRSVIKRPMDSNDYKENLKNSSLYQKFSMKLMAKHLVSNQSPNHTEIFKRASEQSKQDISANQPSTAVNPSKPFRETKPQYGLHKRTESENLKKVRVEPIHELAASGKQVRATSGHKKTVTDDKNAGEDQPTSKVDDKRELNENKYHQRVNASLDLHAMGSAKNGLQSGQKKKLLHIESIKRQEALLPPFDGAKVILKDFGRIKAFSVNTHQGVFRSYNEDRVSILLNAQQR
jgi:hypothetical protein